MTVPSAYNVVVPLDPAGLGYYALFNTLAGSIDVIDDSVIEALRQLGETTESGIPRKNAPARTKLPMLPISPAATDYLDGRGYLWENLDQERVQGRQLYGELIAFHRDVAQIPLAIIPSYNCDLSCPYCWQRLYGLDSPVISDKRIAQAFDAITELVHPKPGQVVELAVFGGEPLQDSPLLRRAVIQILDRARSAGFVAKVITNGVGLKQAVPDLIGRVAGLQVTIDGPSGVHRRRRPLPGGDSFSPMVEGVSAALKAGIMVDIRTNVDSANVSHLPELAEFVRDQDWLDSGLITLHLAPVKNHNPRHKTNPESDILAELLELVDSDERMSMFDLSGFAGLKYFQGFMETGLLPLHRFFNCEAQINFWAFDLFGDLYACWDAAGIRDLAVGRFDPIVEVNELRLNQWRARMSLDIAGCAGCPIQPSCGGGCAFMALEHGGSLFSPTCDSVLAGYVASIRRHADWLVSRATEGDHAVGFVVAGEVAHAVDDALPVLERRDLALNCG